jgi:hypothetical protein
MERENQEIVLYKKESLCLPCGQKERREIPSESDEPGELAIYYRFAPGPARHEFNCERCSVKIPKGAPCEIFSLWAGHVPECERTYLDLP